MLKITIIYNNCQKSNNPCSNSAISFSQRHYHRFPPSGILSNALKGLVGSIKIGAFHKRVFCVLAFDYYHCYVDWNAG